jgi:DNA-binding NarL/FixJ family response regulator
MPRKISARTGAVRAARVRARPGEPSARPGDSPARSRIVVAARPALFCEILSLLLGNEPHFDVAGQARDEDEALALLKGKRPDLLLFDYEGLGPAAEKLIRNLRRAAGGTRVLVLAMQSSDETLVRVLRAGASGLVGKQQSFATLVQAIRSVASGELWANRRAAGDTLERLVSASGGNVSLDARLTRREREITVAVGQGLRNKEIAKSLEISEKTVKSHLNNIFRKLHVDNRFAVGLYSLDQFKPKA